MNWARILAHITGTVDQELLLRNEYLVAEGDLAGCLSNQGKSLFPADTQNCAMYPVPAVAATAGAFEPEAAERSPIHFTVCPQAIEIEYPHSGIFYS